MDLDVSVHVGAKYGERKTYVCPAGLLTASSPYFHAMLSVGMSESTTREIILNDIHPDAWEEWFKFVQPPNPRGNPSIDMDNVSDLLPLFHLFQMHMWTSECERVLADYLSSVTSGAEKNLSQNSVGSFWRQCSEQRTGVFNSIVETYLVSSLYDLSLQQTAEAALNNVLTWIEYTADLFDAETTKKLVPNIDFTSVNYTGVIEAGIMGIIGKSVKDAVVNCEGSHDDIVFALMSSLLREASQKIQIDKLAQRAEAGKKIISTAYTNYAKDMFYSLPHDNQQDITEGTLPQSVAKQTLQHIMMRGFKDMEDQHNILGIAPPHVDEESSLEVQTQDAAYHYIKCNDNNGERYVAPRDILMYLTPLVVTHSRRNEMRTIFPQAINHLLNNGRIATVSNSDGDVLGYASVSLVRSYS